MQAQCNEYNASLKRNQSSKHGTRVARHFLSKPGLSSTHDMMFLSNVCGFQYKEWKQILMIQQVKVEYFLVLVLAKWTYNLYKVHG